MLFIAAKTIAFAGGVANAEGNVPTPHMTDSFAPGERQAVMSCQGYSPEKKFRWSLRGEVDLSALVNAISPMTCRPFIVPGASRQSKVTIVAPDTMTAAEAYRLFLAAIETMGLTIEPQGRTLKIIEAAHARESAIPVYSEATAPQQDQYVTQLFRIEHATVDEMKTVLERLKSKDGDISTFPPTNTLIITDLGTVVHKLAEVVKQLDVPLGGEKIFMIKLHKVPAKEMADLLISTFAVGKSPTKKDSTMASLGNAVSQVIPEDRLNMLIVIATERGFQPLLALAKRLDETLTSQGTSDRVHVLALANANAEDVAATLGALGARSSGAGRTGGPTSPAGTTAAPQVGVFEEEVRVASDKPTNSLVVLAMGHDFVTLQELVRKLDIPRRQVFIEATILEVSIDKTRNLGAAGHTGSTVGSGSTQSLLYGASEPNSSVNSLSFNPSALSGLAVGLRGPPIPGANSILGLPAGTSIPSFSVFLQAVENNGDVNVLSMPHILTTDNEKAELSVGQNLPFPGALGAGALGGSGASGASAAAIGFSLGTSVQRQDVALKLEITPHVNDSDFVRLEIHSEISDVANPNYNGLGPATTKRAIKSIITVRDQQSIVLGGLIKEQVSESVDKTPLLGDIPLLGYLFKHTTKTLSKQNLLIVLTPYVIKDPSDLRRIFERKVRERREFMERYSAFRDERDYDAQVDYRRKRGLLEEINLTWLEAQRDADEVRRAEAAMRARDVDGELKIPISPLAPPANVAPPPTERLRK